MSRLQELSDTIATNAKIINDFLAKEGISQPSFDVDAAPSLPLPNDLEIARTLVLEATLELHELLLGPKELLLSHKPNHLVGLHAVYCFKMAESFSLGEEATFAQISSKCGLNVHDTRRILRHAMAHHIFQEIRKGVVIHTSLSRILAEDPQMQAWLGACVEEMWPSATKTVPAMVKWPNSQEPTHTGFSISNNTEDSIYVEMGKDPARAQRFGLAMSAFATSEGFETNHLIQNGPWNSINEGTIVDLGGAHGDMMITLAKSYPKLRFIVQDLPATITTCPKIPTEVESRIKLMAHDFFDEQPELNADVYFFRWIFHNWSDKYCVRILRNLIPALKPGAIVVINDACLPEPNTSRPMIERYIRTMDLSMLQIQNSREREKGDWETLFHEADARFKFLGVTEAVGSRLAIIQATWEP